MIIPRSQIGVPVPPSTRPLLPLYTDIELAHYTGVFVDGRGMDYNDPTKDWDYAREVAKYGANATPIAKPWEYNYLIGLGGNIFEQAGPYVAAHCKNFNPESLGVLFMVAVNVPLTQAAIDAWWWLDDHLIASHQLSADHERSPHYHYRQTGCCGQQLASVQGPLWDSPTGEGRLGTLIPQLLIHPSLPQPPQPQPLPQEHDMVLFDWNPGIPGKFTGFSSSGPELAWLVRGPARQAFLATGAKPAIINDEQLLALIESSEQKTPPPPTLTPAMLAAWGIKV